MTQVDVVSETVVRSQAKLYDLRTGAVTKALRTIDIAYAKDGRLLRRLGDVYQVIHPDGRAVILSAPDVSGSCLFVGDAFVTKDNRYDRALPYGVYDTNTGALRGRLEQVPNQWGAIQPTFAMTPDDGELWTDDVTSVRCWTMSNVVCTKRLDVPSGSSCLGVALTASGNVITTFRPANGANTNAEIVVLAPKTGRVVSRRKQVHMGVIVAGEIIVAADPEAKRFVFFDEELREMGATPMASLEGYARLVPLWSGRQEFIAVDGFNQFHHYGSPSLAPRNAPGASAEKGAVAAKKPAAKKLAVASEPAPKKSAAKKSVAKTPAAKRPAAKQRGAR